MKRIVCISALVFCIILLSACGGENPQVEENNTTPVSGEEEAIQPCRIVDGAEEGSLLLAALPGGRDSDGGVYRLVVTEHTVVYLDGEEASIDVLKDGMTVDVIYNGGVMETFPAQFGGVRYISAWSLGSQRSPGGTYYDLCGFYLRVLSDLWKADPALNEGKPMAALDLSQAPGGLSESEKQALAWRFGELHGVEVIQGTFDQLLEQGYITAEPLETEDAPQEAIFYHWEDGCLFSITPHETGEESFSLPVLRFDAGKYASSLGAYVFHDCIAVWPEFGTWSEYHVGAEAIS